MSQKSASIFIIIAQNPFDNDGNNGTIPVYIVHIHFVKKAGTGKR